VFVCLNVVVVNAAAECFVLPSSTCRSLGYNLTGLPNVFGQTNQAHAMARLATLLALESQGCSDDITQFACAAAFPQCTDNGRLLHPCKHFCLGELVTQYDCCTGLASYLSFLTVQSAAMRCLVVNWFSDTSKVLQTAINDIHTPNAQSRAEPDEKSKQERSMFINMATYGPE